MIRCGLSIRELIFNYPFLVSLLSCTCTQVPLDSLHVHPFFFKRKIFIRNQQNYIMNSRSERHKERNTVIVCPKKNPKKIRRRKGR